MTSANAPEHRSFHRILAPQLPITIVISAGDLPAHSGHRMNKVFAAMCVVKLIKAARYEYQGADKMFLVTRDVGAGEEGRE